MKIKFYDIKWKIKNNKIYNGKVTLVGEYDFKGDINDFIQEYENKCLFFNSPFKDFELDKTYYIITNDNELYGVITLHKGGTFIDCMEYNDRVIVKNAFPYLKCNIIGELEYDA